MRKLLSLLLIATVLGMAGYYAWTLRPVSSADQLAIREKVALHLIADHGTGIWKDGHHFLRVEGENPSPELLKRINQTHSVLPVSQAEIRLEDSEKRGVFHRKSGERGVLYSVDEITRTGFVRVQIDATFYPHPQGAEGYKCDVEQSEGTWQVESCEMAWIS